MGIDHAVKHKRCDELRTVREARLYQRRLQRKRNKSHKAVTGHRYRHNEAYAKEEKICAICGKVQ
jgi:hypothetical protein